MLHPERRQQNREVVKRMDKIEKVKQAARLCTECNGISCRECPYVEHNNNGVGIPMCGAVFATDVLFVIDELQERIERLKNAMVETGSIHCPCSPDCGDDCEKCVDSAIEETLKTHKPDCDHAEHDSGGCFGYGRNEQDDEPIDACKKCEKYTGKEGDD